MESKFKVGEYVWAKVKGFAAWPSKIVEPDDDEKDAEKKYKQGKVLAYFYGEESTYWVMEDQIWPYDKDDEEQKDEMFKTHLTRGIIPAGIKEAVRLIDEAITACPPTFIRPKVVELPSIEDEISEIFPDKSRVEEQNLGSSSSAKKRKFATTPASVSRKSGAISKHTPSSAVRKAGSLVKKVVSRSATTRQRVTPKSKQYADKSCDVISPVSSYDFLSDRMNSMEMLMSDGQYLPDVISYSSPPGSDMPIKIGFLGLGTMGSNIVTALIQYGHNVTVWNRTPSKCREFMKLGALKGTSAEDVVQTCDITFSCVADAAALRDIFFGPSGVAVGIKPGKSFVDMSSVDVATVTEIYEAVTERGGRFLEAPLIGTLEQTSDRDGEMIVLAAGNKSLYEDCYTCFSSICKKSFYLGEVGSATCMKLVVNMMVGTMLAGLAETLALGEKVGLKQDEILKILALLEVSSPLTVTKGQAMIQGKFNPPQLSLEHMQRDLRLAITLAESVEQPVHVTAATNEFFKKAKARGYGDHDTSAIYRATD